MLRIPPVNDKFPLRKHHFQGLGVRWLKHYVFVYKGMYYKKNIFSLATVLFLSSYILFL